jgi:hypothetical protein
MYDRKALECQNQATALGRRIDEMRAGAPAPAQGAIDLMGLTSRTARLEGIIAAQSSEFIGGDTRVVRMDAAGARIVTQQLAKQTEQ